jgi:hypothetical protein
VARDFAPERRDVVRRLGQLGSKYSSYSCGDGSVDKRSNRHGIAAARTITLSWSPGKAGAPKTRRETRRETYDAVALVADDGLIGVAMTQAVRQHHHHGLGHGPRPGVTSRASRVHCGFARNGFYLFDKDHTPRGSAVLGRCSRRRRPGRWSSDCAYHVRRRTTAKCSCPCYSRRCCEAQPAVR